MLPQIDTMIGFAAVMLLLSLLITILVQGTVAALNLREKNLLWGVTLIVEHALPGLPAARVRDVAEKVLAHKTLDLGVDLPVTAIRSDELVRILGKLAEDDEALAAAIAKAQGGLAQLEAASPIEALLHEAFPGETARVAEVMEKARERARKELGDFRAWYGTVMDRTSERFVRWTRRATVGFAVLLSFGLPIDSLALFQRISTSGDLRAHLTQSADATLKLADAAGAERHLATKALTEARARHPEVTAEIDRDLDTRAQGAQWIQAHAGADAAAFERDYEREYDARLRPLALDLLGSAASVKERLADTQLVLVPGERPPFTRSSLLGMLMSVIFLSLGAPFWYNVLQQLGNLRPILAGKVDSSEAKKPGQSPPGA